MSSTENHSNPSDFTSDYILFYSGQMISLIGSSTVQFIIIWWITITTQSALYLSVASLLGIGSSLATGIFAGVVADRYDRKLIIALTDFLQAIVTVILMVLFYLNIATIFHVLGLLLFRGLFSGFQTPAIQAMIPSMIPKDKLSQINSLTRFTSSIVNLASPVLAALLLGIFGLDNMVPLLAIDGITFVIAIIPLLIVKIPKDHISKRQSNESASSFFGEFKEGFSVISNEQGLIALLISFAMTNFFLSASLSFLPLVVSSPLGLGSDERVLAFGLSAFQAGSILITFLLLRYKLTTNLVKFLTLGITSGMLGIMVAGLGVILNLYLVFWAGLLIVGLAIPLAGIASSVLWQTNIPEEFQGRVFTVRGTISNIITPLSLISIGLLLELMPQTITYILFISGSLGFILYIFAYRFTDIRYIDSNFDRIDQNTETSDVKTPIQELVLEQHKSQ